MAINIKTDLINIKRYIKFQKLRTQQLSVKQRMYFNGGSSRENELLRECIRCYREAQTRDEKNECVQQYFETLKVIDILG